MPFQPAPNTALIEWIYLLDGQLCENTYHVQQSVPFTAGDCSMVATIAYDWWTDEMSPTISEDVTLLRTEVKGLDDPTSPFFVRTPGTLSSGGAGVGATPNNVTFAVKHTTALSGRSSRGRWYVVGIPGTLIVASALGLAQAALYVATFVTLDALLVAEGLEPVIVSRRQNSVVLPEAVNYPITAHSFTDNTVDSQRRRLPGRGA